MAPIRIDADDTLAHLRCITPALSDQRISAHVKSSLLALAMVLASAVEAAECGQNLRFERIEQLLEPILEAQALFDRHKDSLAREVQTILGSARTDIAFARADELNLEIDRIAQIAELTLYVEHALREASTVAQIRDVMQDSQDKLRVNQILSLKVIGAGRMAERAATGIGNVLTGVSSSSVAIDVSKLRDAVGMVAKVFEGCDAPKSAP